MIFCSQQRKHPWLNTLSSLEDGAFLSLLSKYRNEHEGVEGNEGVEGKESILLGKVDHSATCPLHQSWQQKYHDDVPHLCCEDKRETQDPGMW